MRYHNRFIYRHSKVKFTWVQIGEILFNNPRRLQDVCLHEIAWIKRQQDSREIVIDLLQNYQYVEFNNEEAPLDEREVRKYLKIEDLNPGIYGMAIDS